MSILVDDPNTTHSFGGMALKPTHIYVRVNIENMLLLILTSKFQCCLVGKLFSIITDGLSKYQSCS